MGDKVYIAGPMSGYEEFNFPAFNKAEELLRKSYGYEHVVNPAKLHPHHRSAVGRISKTRLAGVDRL